MKIAGTERALPKEKILLNITLLKEGIANIRLYLSQDILLKVAYNYNLEKKSFLKKEINFEVSSLNFEKNLALGFISNKRNENNSHESIKIEALDIENNVKEMSIFDIEILRPEVNVELMPGMNTSEIQIKMEKTDRLIGAKFDGFNFSAEEQSTGKSVKVDLEKYTLDEFIESIDNIPEIIDWKTAFKRIVINSNKPIKLFMRANYSDMLGNKYESNQAEIKLSPILDEETIISKNEIIANPIFETIGFGAQAVAVV